MSTRMQPVRDLNWLRIRVGWESRKLDWSTGFLWCLSCLSDTSCLLFEFLSYGLVPGCLIFGLLFCLLYLFLLLLLLLFLHGIFVSLKLGDKFLSPFISVLGSLLFAYHFLLLLILFLLLCFLFLVMCRGLLLTSFILLLFLNCFVFHVCSLSNLLRLHCKLLFPYLLCTAIVFVDKLRLVHRAERWVKVQKAICLRKLKTVCFWIDVFGIKIGCVDRSGCGYCRHEQTSIEWEPDHNYTY